MSEVSLPLTGGCLCGACRFKVTAAPLLAYACHCTDCQTQSGSAFALTVLLSSKSLELTGARVRTSRVTPTGRALSLYFCESCRVRLDAQGDASPEFASLRAGTLDDARWVRPIAQFYADSALPWAVLPGVAIIDAKNVDFGDLARQWALTKPTFVSPDLAEP